MKRFLLKALGFLTALNMYGSLQAKPVERDIVNDSVIVVDDGKSRLDKYVDNVFISGGVGFNSIVGDKDRFLGVDGSGPAGGLSVGIDLSDLVALKGDFKFGEIRKSGFDHWFDSYNLSVVLKSDYFFSDPSLSLSAQAGFGVFRFETINRDVGVHIKKESQPLDRVLEGTVNFGLNLEVYGGSNSSFGLSFMSNFMDTDWLDGIKSGKRNDVHVNSSFVFTHYLGGHNKSQSVLLDDVSFMFLGGAFKPYFDFDCDGVGASFSVGLNKPLVDFLSGYVSLGGNVLSSSVSSGGSLDYWDNNFGVGLNYSVPVSDNLFLYVRGGGSLIQSSAVVRDVDGVVLDYNGASGLGPNGRINSFGYHYGGGVEYSFSDNFSFVVDLVSTHSFSDDLDSRVSGSSNDMYIVGSAGVKIKLFDKRGSSELIDKKVFDYSDELGIFEGFVQDSSGVDLSEDHFVDTQKAEQVVDLSEDYFVDTQKAKQVVDVFEDVDVKSSVIIDSVKDFDVVDDSSYVVVKPKKGQTLSDLIVEVHGFTNQQDLFSLVVETVELNYSSNPDILIRETIKDKGDHNWKGSLIFEGKSYFIPKKNDGVSLLLPEKTESGLELVAKAYDGTVSSVKSLVNSLDYGDVYRVLNDAESRGLVNLPANFRFVNASSEKLDKMKSVISFYKRNSNKDSLAYMNRVLGSNVKSVNTLYSWMDRTAGKKVRKKS